MKKPKFIKITFTKSYTYLVDECDGKTMKDKRRKALNMAVFDLYYDIDLLSTENTTVKGNHPFKIKIN